MMSLQQKLARYMYTPTGMETRYEVELKYCPYT